MTPHQEGRHEQHRLPSHNATAFSLQIDQLVLVHLDLDSLAFQYRFGRSHSDVCIELLQLGMSLPGLPNTRRCLGSRLPGKQCAGFLFLQECEELDTQDPSSPESLSTLVCAR